MGLNADGFAVSNPVEIHLVIVEQLGDNYISSSINFLFKMLDVIFSAGGCHVYLWISSDHNTEIITVSFFDECHELGSISKTIIYGFPFVDSRWWITSQSQNVSNAVLLGFVESIANFVSGHTCAGQMHEDIETEVLGDMSAKI